MTGIIKQHMTIVNEDPHQMGKVLHLVFIVREGLINSKGKRNPGQGSNFPSCNYKSSSCAIPLTKASAEEKEV